MHRYIAVTLVAAATITAITLTHNSAVAASDTVTVAGQTRTVTGTNINRTTNALVIYTPARGTTTRTNIYGFEASVVDGKVINIVDGVGNMAIPDNGIVLSGHGTSRTWLKTYAKVGVSVYLPGETPPPPSAEQLLPDATVRTLRQFTIVNTSGRKLLKFPGVTANTGKGPFEIHGHRSSSSSTDWQAVQTVYYDDGSKQSVVPSGLTFYYAGDGHTHWHMKDFDSYELLNIDDQLIKIGEKHGFCFEDNTQYRNWPGNPNFPAAPASPVYTHNNVCGVNEPQATEIMHGLSVGWADTYPSSLPDQAIDITDVPNGQYKVEIIADQGNWLIESNENNNASWALITINGNSVTLNSTGGGS